MWRALPKKLFQKGHKPLNPAGRPKGTKDKSYLTLQFWHDELMKDWPKLKPAQRAKLSIQMEQMLVNKMKALPSNPEDSVRNVEESLKALKMIEGGQEMEMGEIKKELEPISPPPPDSTIWHFCEVV